MKLVVQRARNARVTVGEEVVGEIDAGMVVLAGFEKDDVLPMAAAAAAKLALVRIFADGDGKMNLNIREAGGGILAIPNFTLAAVVKGGRRPSFDRSASPEEAQPLFQALVEAIRSQGIPVATGRFGASMAVTLTNDGPATFVLTHDDF